MSLEKVLLTANYLEGKRARTIPGAIYSSHDNAWTLSNPTPRAAAVALRLFPRLGAEYPELVELRSTLAQEIRPIDKASDFAQEINAARVRNQLARKGFSFYPYQAIDLGYLAAIMREHGSGYLGWERGLGKTLGACALIDELDVRRALIVCPNTAKRAVWQPELDEWLPEHTAVVMGNTAKQRDRAFAQVEELTRLGESVVLVIHYEALSIELARLTKFDPTMVIADEVHRIRNGQTKMAKSIKKLKPQYKLGLSGSIISNHAEELFSQIQWLYPKVYRSKWRDWNDRYLDFVDGGWGKICVGVKIEKLDELRNELGVYMTYRRKEDELELPERTEQYLKVDLSPSQRRVYDQLRDEYVAQLDDGTLVAATDGLVLLGKLRQVATGLNLVADSVDDSAKLDLAQELILDNEDEAFVVFSWYKAAAYALADRLRANGVESFVVTGDTKHEDRANYIREFQAASGPRVFIGTLSTLGESVTLHRASNAIFLDRSWNPSDNTQAADRIYRIGQTKPVTITHIVAADTVDETRVLPALNDKEALRRMILGS